MKTKEAKLGFCMSDDTETNNGNTNEASTEVGPDATVSKEFRPESTASDRFAMTS